MSKNQASSSLLSSQENIALAELIERKTQSLASAVVQVFLALPANSHTWTKECSGVACFIKDNPRRSYYIRVYSLKKGAVVWEQELYNQIEYRAPHSHLHTFAADDCEAGLNFADEQEARKFHLIVQEKIRQRQSRQEKRHHGPPLPSQPPERKRPSISHQTPNVERSGPEAQNSGSLIIPTMPIQNPDITSFRYRGLPTAAPIDKKKKKEKGKGKKKMTKADIGAPSNFLHVGHVGWDPNKGFDVNEMDPDLKNLFHKAGISEDQMTDAETSKVLYDFIEHQGGLEAMKEQMRKQDLAPTPPTRSSHPPPVPPPPSSATPPPRGRQGPLPPLPPPSSSGISPPPPPPPSSGQPRSHLPPPPPRGGGGGQRGPPPVPRPPENPAPPAPWGAAAPPPPPPPPPPPSLAPPPGGGLGGNRPELTPAPSSGRGALLDQIRTGRALKKVTNIPEVSQPPEPESDGLVGALMMVMKQRSKVIHSSDEGEDEGVDDDFDDEWDD